MTYHLPVFFHNLKGYDGFHVLRGLKGYERMAEAKIEVIAQTMDRFTSFTIDRIRFMDTAAFLKSSLDAMVTERSKGTLAEKKKNWPRLYKEFIEPLLWEEQLKHVYAGGEGQNELPDSDALCEKLFDQFMKKGIYPYEYMDSKDRLAETELPGQGAFFSMLNNSGADEKDMAQAQAMWNLLKCDTMRDYTLEYCRLDVILLADIFEGLRAKCLDFETGYGLDPVHYVTAPSLSWAAMLLSLTKRGIRVENMTDPDMVAMVRNNIRGGMCQVMNPPCDNELDKPDVHFVAWDVTNLYGWSMKYCMPLGDYRWEYNPGKTLDENWVNQPRTAWDDVDFYNPLAVEMEIMAMEEDCERGVILEVDLEVPDGVHDYLNDYPPCPHQVCCDNPSEYTKMQYAKEGITWKPPVVPKLVSDLMPKQRYTMHYRTLQQALGLGLRLTKVHRMFSFKQSRWLAEYIDFNTRRREECAKEGDMSGKELYKLMTNSIYGKTVSNGKRGPPVIRRRVKSSLQV